MPVITQTNAQHIWEGAPVRKVVLTIPKSVAHLKSEALMLRGVLCRVFEIPSEVMGPLRYANELTLSVYTGTSKHGSEDLEAQRWGLRWTADLWKTLQAAADAAKAAEAAKAEVQVVSLVPKRRANEPK